MAHATERRGRARYQHAGKRRAAKRPRFYRGRAAAVFAVMAVLLLGACTSLAVYYNAQLGDVDRISALTDDGRRPAEVASAEGAMNILLMGTDNGNNGSSIKEELADGEWTPGSHRSDTMMILHITQDRDSAYLVSIPRDSYVKIPGYGHDKINAAFSYGGPLLTQRTVEHVTNVRIDHLVMIDWSSFKDLTTAKVLWSNPAMSYREEFDVPASSNTLDPTTFFGQDANALDRLSNEFARALVSAILEAF